MNILNRVLTEIKENRMTENGDKIVVGVSGGPDSVALLDILVKLSDQLGITICVAHLDHGFRGKEAETDAAFVDGLAQEYGIEVVIEKCDAPAYMKERHLTAQEAARELRFDFLNETARQKGGRRIALGHHRDDQAETILLNILRGSGPSGLKGMLPVRDGLYIRPLLTLSKDEILEYCRLHDLQFRTDSSNLKPVYLRNCIRLKLMPFLESNFNKNIVCNLNRLGIICRDEDDFIEGQALEFLSKIKINESDKDYDLDIGKLLQTPVAIQRRIVRIAYRQLNNPKGELTFFQVEKILTAIKKNVARGTIDLPGGVRAVKNYGSLSFVCSDTDEARSALSYCHSLTVPGATYIPELDLTALLEIKDAKQVHLRPELLPVNEVLLDHDLVGSPVYVRSRKPGDIFNPFGMKGKVKLKKFMINSKIPAGKRDSIPIFTNMDDIIWVGGVRPADKYRVLGNTKNILHIKLLPGKFK